MLEAGVHLSVLISAFAVIWFITLFCLLPVGLGSERDPDTGALNELHYIDENTVFGVGNKVQGKQCFGAIKDPNAQLRAMRYFPRMVDKTNDDPAKEYTLTQSAPLPVPLEPNNTWKLQVHDPEEELT